LGWRYLGFEDLLRIAGAHAAASTVVLAAVGWSQGTAFPRSIYVLDFLLCLLLDVSVRASMRLLFDNDSAFFLALERFGYDISDGHAAIRAFQRRWRPHKITGEIDGQIGALLFELLLERDMGHAR